MNIIISLLLPIAKVLIQKAIENSAKKDELKKDFDSFYLKLSRQNASIGSESTDFDSL